MRLALLGSMSYNAKYHSGRTYLICIWILEKPILQTYEDIQGSEILVTHGL